MSAYLNVLGGGERLCAACRVFVGECPDCGTFWWYDEPTGKRVGQSRPLTGFTTGSRISQRSPSFPAVAAALSSQEAGKEPR